MPSFYQAHKPVGEMVTNGTVPWTPVLFVPAPMDYTSFVLSFFYLLITIWPTVQLIRLHQRNPSGSWTTQKIFFVLTLVANLVRTVFFALAPFVRHHVFFGQHDVQRYTVFTILDDLPCDIYFTTYTLLILFWAEVIQHAKDRSPNSTKKLRPTFFILNAVVYLVQLIIWVLILVIPNDLGPFDLADNIFFAIISLIAAGGFVSYGGRLYYMLKSFPIESKSRQRKLREVGLVAAVCTTCFAIRAGLIIYSSINTEPMHWAFVGVFFLIVEITPSALVLFMLRHLPAPKSVQPLSNPAAGSLRRSHYGGISGYSGGASESSTQFEKPLLGSKEQSVNDDDDSVVPKSAWRKFFSLNS